MPVRSQGKTTSVYAQMLAHSVYRAASAVLSTIGPEMPADDSDRVSPLAVAAWSCSDDQKPDPEETCIRI